MERTGVVKVIRLVKRGRKPLYPWQEWLGSKGSVTRLVKGKNYQCAPHGFAMAARKAAYRLGISLSVRITEERGLHIVTLENKGTVR